MAVAIQEWQKISGGVLIAVSKALTAQQPVRLTKDGHINNCMGKM